MSDGLQPVASDSRIQVIIGTVIRRPDNRDMGYGVFGKLPQKRDFISKGIPDAVLHPFESWLQSAVAASRAEMGRDWEEHYLVAPIWRFWIGYEIFGQACTGALMPSVDKVGRFFPLTLLYCAAEGDATAPPPFEPAEDWYASIEARLLTVLDEEEADIEIDRLVADLPEPATCGESPGPHGEPFKGGAIWQAKPEEETGDLVKSLVESDYWQAASSRSYWWTAGGVAGAAIAHARAGLPDPYFFSRMIRTGS